MADKRLVEVFTAGCPVCEPVVSLVKSLACPSCEVMVYDLREGCDTSRRSISGRKRPPGEMDRPALQGVSNASGWLPKGGEHLPYHVSFY